MNTATWTTSSEFPPQRSRILCCKVRHTQNGEDKDGDN